MSSLLDRTCFSLLVAGIENPRCIGSKCSRWEDCCISLLESEVILQEWSVNPDLLENGLLRITWGDGYEGMSHSRS